MINKVRETMHQLISVDPHMPSIVTHAYSYQSNH
jgi:hypothetical protein